MSSIHGLSPPTRGSRGRSSRDVIYPRSIPAHAGEPELDEPLHFRGRVYPRPRGGACNRVWSCAGGGGLSPPTRGSLRRWTHAGTALRSIPAHAGEPGVRISWFNETRGLSPPTRGSPSWPCANGCAPGSIPAHAGEPPLQGQCCPHLWVYPRPRGGARRMRLARFRTVALRGLSPPTRGSP